MTNNKYNNAGNPPKVGNLVETSFGRRCDVMLVPDVDSWLYGLVCLGFRYEDQHGNIDYSYIGWVKPSELILVSPKLGEWIEPYGPQPVILENEKQVFTGDDSKDYVWIENATSNLTEQDIAEINTILSGEYNYDGYFKLRSGADVMYRCFTKSNASYSGTAVVRVYDYLRSKQQAERPAYSGKWILNKDERPGDDKGLLFVMLSDCFAWGGYDSDYEFWSLAIPNESIQVTNREVICWLDVEIQAPPEQPSEPS